jgi:hypothetical protein
MNSGSRVGISHKEIIARLPKNLALDIREDIASDVLEALLIDGMPENLRKLMRKFTNKNIKLYVKPKDTTLMSNFPSSLFGENKITKIVDETSLMPFEDRFVVEIE